MRRTKEDAAKTRQDLLDAALKLFSEKGYQATRLQDIARAAGTTRGAIYHHFDNKAGLYRSLIDEASDQGNRAVQESIAAGGSPAEIVRRILVKGMEMLAHDRRFRQAWALSLFRTGVVEELADIEQRRIGGAAASVDSIAAMFQIGIDGGSLRADLDPRSAALAFLAYQNGVSWLWLANGEFFSIDDRAQSLADILMVGLTG